ncbi:cytochrome c-type biogenesis protein [Motiliproteus sediminis]|uniref:cytochrome c-type biogenesis protein n=1 Tax=Motiliproteus sediminis TaxID=1468178 RepID=UPI002484CE4F|nr:cytochrome c-type biogenesis protein [Motiliproteus sediminis]
MKQRVNLVLQTLLLLTLGLGSTVASAAIEAYEFRDEAMREQFKVLTAELRCPKCQNQNLADSNAPIAKDMREKIYEMVQQGESTESVVEFMVARYGDFVNYRPRNDSSTALLWYGPVALLVIGGLVVVAVSRSRSRSKSGAVNKSAVDRERLQKLLHDNDKA